MPAEVIIPWSEFKKMEELLGLDLDKTAIEDLKQAKKDRESGKKGAYVNLNSI
jgi:PHD/YefM family antitoxin component YafN of YafNO toxin-antitoxin module